MRSAPGSRLYCPYCYEDFAEQEIRFRCTGRISRDGRHCDPEIDEVLRGRTGFSGALPPVFAANGRLTSAPCPRCGAGTTTRVCPACHSQLPVHFGKVRSRLIVLVGAKQSGKTVFMTVLVHELMHQLGEQLKAAVSGADDSTRHRFASEYEKPLYRESQLLAPTTTAGMRNRVPLVFRFTTGGRGLFGLDGRLGRGWPGRGGPQHTLLSFFDPAGEDLRSQQSVEQNVRYLAAADGIVLLLDPLQMRGARQLAAPGSRLPTPGTTDDEPATVLENITDLILATGGEKAERADQQAARHRVLQDGRAAARPAGRPARCGGPRSRRRTSTSGTARRYTPRSSGCWPGGRGPGSTRSPSCTTATTAISGCPRSGRRPRRTTGCRPAASAPTGSPTRSCGPSRSWAPFR